MKKQWLPARLATSVVDNGMITIPIGFSALLTLAGFALAALRMSAATRLEQRLATTMPERFDLTGVVSECARATAWLTPGARSRWCCHPGWWGARRTRPGGADVRQAGGERGGLRHTRHAHPHRAGLRGVHGTWKRAWASPTKIRRFPPHSRDGCSNPWSRAGWATAATRPTWACSWCAYSLASRVANCTPESLAGAVRSCAVLRVVS